MSYPSVSITSDIVVINGDLQVLVIKRKNSPYRHHWALPGGYVDENETFLEAAVRELKEETGIDAPWWELTPMTVRDTPDRDPRGRVVSLPFRWYTGRTLEPVAGDDATEFDWRSPHRIGLAFDHDEIVAEAMSRYR
jgi:8-oxo-dGTP diphosphatase